MKKIIAISLVIVSLLFVFTACGPKHQGTQTVKMTFENYGTITIELYGDQAPITVNHFVELVKSGYYNGTSISRVQNSFVMQGGQGKGTGTIKGEFEENGVHNTIAHKKGVLSMARSQSNDSASDQFFVCLDDDTCAQLDGRYAAFGKIVEGYDVIEKIVKSITEDDYVEIVDYYSYYQASMGFLRESSYIKIISAEVVD